MNIYNIDNTNTFKWLIYLHEHYNNDVIVCVLYYNIGYIYPPKIKYYVLLKKKKKTT